MQNPVLSKPQNNPVTDESEILRSKLKASGWHWVPGQGKRILYDGWNKGVYDYDAAEWAASKNPAWSNTGILQDQTIARDVDAKILSTAAKLAKATVLGESPCGTRYGSKGSATLYGVTAPMRSITVRGIAPGDTKKSTIVEYIGMTRQLMCYGIHPDTGKPYRWEGKSPRDVPVSEFTKYARADFIVQAQRDKAIALADGWTEVTITLQATDADKQEARAGDGGLVSMEMLEKMLSHVDPGQDHNECLRIVAALKHAEACELVDDPDFSAEEVADKWSRGDYQQDKQAPANYLDGWSKKRFDSLDAFKEGGVKFASLVHAARAGGYKGFSRIDSPFDYIDDEDSELPYDVRNVLYPEQFQRKELPEVTEAKVRDKTLYQEIANSFLTSEELDARTGLTQYVVDNWIPFEGNTYIFGKRGGGKTIATVDLCLNGQADRKWMGTHNIEKGCTFVYIALEHPTGINTAIQAWQAAHPNVPINPRRFKICTYPINAFVKNADQIMKALSQVIRDTMDHKRVIFVFDTQQRFAPGDQNNGDNMAVASAVAESYAKEFKGASILLGHSPKSNEETLSGSGILENNSFALIGLNKLGNGMREMKVLRIKDAPEDSYSRYEIVGQVIPGLDKTGKPREGGIARHRAGTTDAGQGMLERQEAAAAKARVLVEDIFNIIGAGQHALNDVATKCSGKVVGYQELPGGQMPERKLERKSALLQKIKALAGSVWPLRNGIHELEVVPGIGGTGPGTGGKVIIRKLLPGI